MSHIAIQAENLGKRYRIGLKEQIHDTLGKALLSSITAPISNLKRLRKLTHFSENDSSEEVIWALKDVSLEVKKGEVVGIIGPNGAGKTTFLKILARITEPTTGRVRVRGQVSSLLEVGTGFHPELTGRENIYLNGTILGMSKKDIERKFDQIVAFSEVEKFLETPVKRYSSGMRVRLAFSVAAHLEPEILLVDEVLAVGDIAFQKKCLGKMHDVSRSGRTVLFVSHNLSAVKELCDTSIVFQNGKVKFRGPVVEGISQYTSGVLNIEDRTVRSGWSDIRINGKMAGFAIPVENSEQLSIEAVLEVEASFTGGSFFLHMTDPTGNCVIHERTDMTITNGLQPGRYRVSAELPPLWLAPHLYSVQLKFIGFGLANENMRLVSNNFLIDFKGRIERTLDATLSPKFEWNLLKAEST